MKKSKKQNVKRVLDNWRNVTESKFALAYFMGFWTMMTDEEASYLLSLLTKEEFDKIMDYPIWM